MREKNKEPKKKLFTKPCISRELANASALPSAHFKALVSSKNCVEAKLSVIVNVNISPKTALREIEQHCYFHDFNAV